MTRGLHDRESHLESGSPQPELGRPLPAGGRRSGISLSNASGISTSRRSRLGPNRTRRRRRPSRRLRITVVADQLGLGAGNDELLAIGTLESGSGRLLIMGRIECEYW